MTNRILDQRLDEEAGHSGVERGRIDVPHDAQSVAEAALIVGAVVRLFEECERVFHDGSVILEMNSMDHESARTKVCG